MSFTDLLDHRHLVTRQLRRRDKEWSLWLLRPLGHIFMQLPERVWQGAKVIVELPENVYTLLTRGGSAPLQIEDIEPGIDWTGGVVRVGRRWVYKITVVYVTAAGGVKSRVFDTFEIKEGPRSDLVWRDGDDRQRSRIPGEMGAVYECGGVSGGVCGVVSGGCWELEQAFLSCRGLVLSLAGCASPRWTFLFWRLCAQP